MNQYLFLVFIKSFKFDSFIIHKIILLQLDNIVSYLRILFQIQKVNILSKIKIKLIFIKRHNEYDIY